MIEIPAQHGARPASAPTLRAAGPVVVALQRVTTRSNFTDLVLDLDVQAGMGAAAAGHEPANALGPGHCRANAGEVADVVSGYQLVDQLQPSLVPDGLDEQPDLELVELADALHLAMVWVARSPGQGRIPEGFPSCFCPGCSVGLRCIVGFVQFIAGGALLERERELKTLAEGLGRACTGDGTLLLVQGPAGVGKTVLAREARAVAGRNRMLSLEARGSELEQPFAFGVVRQLLEQVVSREPDRDGLFAGGAGPGGTVVRTGRATVAGG